MAACGPCLRCLMTFAPRHQFRLAACAPRFSGPTGSETPPSAPSVTAHVSSHERPDLRGASFRRLGTASDRPTRWLNRYPFGRSQRMSVLLSYLGHMDNKEF